MWGFNKKRFLITLGLSFLLWLISVVIQVIFSYKTSFSLFGSTCQLTGFPIARCVYESKDQLPSWFVVLVNIFLWFWVIHLFWNFVSKKRVENNNT